MRVSIVLALALSARPGGADSLLNGGTTPADVELTIRDMLRSDAPLVHLGILNSLRGGSPAFFEHHLRADPANDLRVLDAGLAHAHAHRPASARRARALLAPLAERSTDPAMKVAAAIGLAQAEADLGGRAGWHRPSRDKAQVVALLAEACRAHVAAPIVGLGETVAAFAASARLYRGYTNLDELAACGRVRAPDHPPDGLFVHSRWPDGSSRFEMEWRGGKRNGKARRFHEDGTLAMESTWVDDRLTGVERTYFPSGVLESESTYRGGFRDGPAVGYHPTGTKHWEGRYQAGRKIGTWRRWDRDGRLTEERAP